MKVSKIKLTTIRLLVFIMLTIAVTANAQDKAVSPDPYAQETKE